MCGFLLPPYLLVILTFFKSGMMDIGGRFPYSA